MLRSLTLVLATLAFLPVSFRYPAAGAICWIWFSMMNPQQEIYGFAAGQHFAFVVAGVTLLGWLLSPERKRWTPDLMPKLMLIFAIWLTFNSFFALVPDLSWHYWSRFMRGDFALAFLVFFIAHRKARIHAIIWIVVISIGYYAVKGGIFTILTGGNYIVFGPGSSIISDNNDLALAVIMTLPLLNYLWLHSQALGLRLGLAAATFLEIVMVLGTHSRGGAIALGATLMMLWTTGRKKLRYGVAGGVVIIVALALMPESYYMRLDTISHPGSDLSFVSRMQAWHVALDVAVHRFPFGAGFYAPQVSWIFHQYLPDAIPHAAHSIYFQVLGEDGFIGLALYLFMIALALHNSGVVMRQTGGQVGLLWAYDLARMIRVSLVGFCIGGAALSMAYYSGFVLSIALLSALREITAQPRPAGSMDLNRPSEAYHPAAHPVVRVRFAKVAGD